MNIVEECRAWLKEQTTDADLFDEQELCRRLEAEPRRYRVAKRAMDFVLSGLALLLLTPLMLMIALAVWLCDGGPVLYRQCRLTKDRQVFQILKFRTMRVDAEEDGVARLACVCDERITTVGKVLRRTRLDELPQFINVLKGEMTLVGPRPERPEIAARYEQILPEFALRVQVKAGITGLAQVCGEYSTPPREKLRMDLMYMANRSAAKDIRLLFATLRVLLHPERTEGVAPGQQTAVRESGRACGEEHTW